MVPQIPVATKWGPTFVETDGGDGAIRRKLTDPEDMGGKVEGSNPAAGIKFSLSKSLLNINPFH